MTVEFPSEQEHFDAVKALLTTANAVPYDYDEKVPSSVTAYTLLTVTDRFGGVQRNAGGIGTRSVRITVRAVGKFADDVREMRRRSDAALRQRVVTVGDYDSTPIGFETAEGIAPDGDIRAGADWFSALSTYTYTV